MAGRVLLVGHCNPDQNALRRWLSSRFEVEFESAESTKAAAAAIQQAPFDLALVNRIFDATGESGIAWIQQLRDDQSALRCMLISNFPQYQQQAVEAGAEAGFGKSQIGDSEVLDSLARWLAPKPAER